MGEVNLTPGTQRDIGRRLRRGESLRGMPVSFFDYGVKTVDLGGLHGTLKPEFDVDPHPGIGQGFSFTALNEETNRILFAMLDQPAPSVAPTAQGIRKSPTQIATTAPRQQAPASRPEGTRVRFSVGNSEAPRRSTVKPGLQHLDSVGLVL